MPPNGFRDCPARRYSGHLGMLQFKATALKNRAVSGEITAFNVGGKKQTPAGKAKAPLP